MEEIKMLKNYKSFELLEQYLSYLTVIKGRSINTVIEYCVRQVKMLAKGPQKG